MNSDRNSDAEIPGLPPAELWRVCLDAAPAGIAMFDRDMRYLAVNRRFRDSLRLADAPLVGRSHYEVLPEIPAHWREVHRRCLAGDSASHEADAFVRADGSIEWRRWSIHPWRNNAGAVGGIVLFAEDVTAAVAATAERQQLADAFVNAAFGMIIGDPETGTIRYANPAYAAMRGMKVDEVVGTSPLEFYRADERARVAAMRELADALGKHVFDSVYCRKDGSSFPVQVHLTSVRKADGNVRYRLGTYIDITEREQTETRLRQAQKMEAVGQLTGGVAHDFNNLLTVVIGNLDTLLEERSDDALVRDLASQAVAAAERGAELTKQLLAFSSRQPLQPQRVEANELIAKLANLLRKIFHKSIVIETKLAPDLWPVQVDPIQLESALMHLATNARDAMPDGGRLSLRSMNVHHDGDDASSIPELPPGHYVALEAEDTGTGIAPDILTRIFEPFFTTKEVGKGSGLGLSMVYGFAKQSGGHVTVESKLQAGTTLRLYLPRLSVEMVEQTTAAAPRPSTSGRTVLLVEDDNAVRRVTVTQLQRLGYRVLDVNSAAAALTALEKASVDVLISDVMMAGGMDGTELARLASQRWPQLRVLLISGYPGDRGDETRGERFRILAKPFRAAQLSRALQQVLDQAS